MPSEHLEFIQKCFADKMQHLTKWGNTVGDQNHFPPNPPPHSPHFLERKCYGYNELLRRTLTITMVKPLVNTTVDLGRSMIVLFIFFIGRSRLENINLTHFSLPLSRIWIKPFSLKQVQRNKESEL